jgi:hypothetical protein
MKGLRPLRNLTPSVGSPPREGFTHLWGNRREDKCLFIGAPPRWFMLQAGL